MGSSESRKSGGTSLWQTSRSRRPTSTFRLRRSNGRPSERQRQVDDVLFVERQPAHLQLVLFDRLLAAAGSGALLAKPFDFVGHAMRQFVGHLDAGFGE